MAVNAALRAIAEPRRREILQVIRRSEMSAGEIAAQFDVTRPAISQHLKVLMDAGLVSVRTAGTKRMYRARPEGLTELMDYLSRFWEDRLGRLAREAEAEEETRKGIEGQA